MNEEIQGDLNEIMHEEGREGGSEKKILKESDHL